ncbi:MULTISPECIES: flagellar hook assembly protein FlgD [Methylomonas]|uniref:Basal-body rod modification protein FlgD n=2 Tax=Methylomonas TaxID=416 RepID=A0A126T682_9GAMM|nr:MULTISPECIES: flagellar hook assembly protein FlgD [Methylomonas]AMK77568.1 flagellar hook capping protein [Methylomonas denitrificans]OAI05148.1 flagellar hook capping protein [Methylomonas methanica]TCV84389.1 flagellar basal-body rod modification protein FlgD [Methylomonas methanica]
MTSAIDTFNSLGLATTGSGTAKGVQKQTLGQDQFLKLLTTQMTHQDPMKPMDNGEFLGQMAQFSTVSGIQDLQASFKDFASSLSSDQALQAAGLVGRHVSAPAKEALLGAGGSVSGDFEMPSSSPNVSVKIIDPQTGATVREIDMGAQSAGTTTFEWDGKDSNEQLADPGIYKIQAEAKIDGVNTVLSTNIKSLVKSVTMGGGSSGLQVNLDGVGTVKFSQIKQIL